MTGQNEDLSWGCWGRMDHLCKAMVVFACTGLVTSRTVQTTHGELSQPQVPDSARPPGSRLSGPSRPREVNVQWALPTPTHTLCSKQGLGASPGPPPLGRQAIQGIFKGPVDKEGVLTVQVDGALVMGQWLAPGSVGGCQEVRQPVDSH